MPHEPLRHDTDPEPIIADRWWRGAVIYEIYPRSYRDSNGDGIGDLAGIVAGLDHLKMLGVDAIWIAPFYKSPMLDFGYDVADYCEVDPIFGNLADFDAVIAGAHARGIKVIIDLVPSHTAAEHPWFAESRRSKDNPKADWYVWADAKPEGSPPNNWLAVFGGPAWHWDTRRHQYYQHNFLVEQPQLNLHNPEVRDALLDAARFWLKRGVDGFRLDAIDWAVQDQRLRSNPPRQRVTASGGAGGSPFEMQVQRFNKSRPELGELLLKPLHRVCAEFGGALLLGEVSGDYSPERAAEYTSGGGLDTVYTFDLPFVAPNAAAIKETVDRYERRIGAGWISWALGNHDVVRPVTRFGADQPEAMRLLLPVLLTSLRGTICMYQGEELGLDQVELTFDQIQDPFGKAFWPEFKGRDGCRTPLPWTAEGAHAGFTTGEPWLPIPARHQARAIDRQLTQPGSVLRQLADFLAWRQQQPALRLGSQKLLVRGECLCIQRQQDGRQVTGWFNLGPAPAEIPVPRQSRLAHAADGVACSGKRLTLPGWGFAFIEPSI